MYIIEAGAVMALLLGGMCVSILLLVPLTNAIKRWFCVGPKKLARATASAMPAWKLWIHNAIYNGSRWIHFTLNIALVVGIYWFMGVSVTAHVSVVAFELLWHFVVGPVFSWFLSTKPSVRVVHGRVDERRFRCVA